MSTCLSPRSPLTLSNRLDLFFAGLGQGVNAAGLCRSRRRELEGLYAKSDAELILMGLTRAEIPAYVFADLFGSSR